MKNPGTCLIRLGTVLVLAAVLLFGYNQWEDFYAGRQAETLLAEMDKIIPELPEVELTPSLQPDDADPDAMPVALIDGYEYIGRVSIPAIQRDLPVMADWDYQRLKKAPCRHAGSTRTDDLVIAGHNYKRHFGNLKQLQPGDAVLFTEIDGTVHPYEVSSVEIIPRESGDLVLNSGHDLALYTCTYARVTRVAVFCDRV